MLSTITELSNFYGSDPRFVLAGGGNTSVKDDRWLYVKPSGVSLASIKPENFVKMDRSVIRQCFGWGEFDSAAEREARIKSLMAFAVAPGSSGRPSVEAPLHELMEFKFVVHLHPTLVNAMTCGADGKAIAARLFPDALWVDYVDPGFTLAKFVSTELARFTEARGFAPKVIFLQNHGVFVGADSAEELRGIYTGIMTKLEEFVAAAGVSAKIADGPADPAAVAEFAPLLRGWLAGGNGAAPVTVVSAAAPGIARGPLTPDHLVYSKAFGLVTEAPTCEAVEAFRAERGYYPKMVEIPGRALFCAGADKKGAETVLLLARNGAEIEALAPAFGGIHYLNDAQRSFIENWEVESYRSKVAAGSAKPLRGQVAVVTGGAQGFGLGIARYLAEQGADIAVADLNDVKAREVAVELGAGARGFKVDISDEESVAALVSDVTAAYGGADILVANAGVVIAGSVKEFDVKKWQFVTAINYTGYFLCVKHFARLMAKQNSATGRWSDIVQVNSKSGLEGSKNNGAYAGSKFGTIGQTQSFALELVGDHIKVNSICPGNYLEGPLWNDPEKGLFVQYLRSGKVPGAKTVADVRAYYEAKVPMGRGCLPDDVARAIVYVVTQQYETGQAVPVTGGQVMLS